MFKEYIVYRKWLIISFLVNCCIVAFVGFLYHSNMEGVFYALGLCLLVFVCFVVGDIIAYAKKRNERKRMQLSLGSGDVEYVKTTDPVEGHYVEMLEELSMAYATAQDEGARDRRARQEYYTTWVHQIKTPIAAMNMLLQQNDTKENRDLRVQLFRIEEYVEMVLHYSRLEEGGQDFVFEKYDLDNLLRQCIRKYAPLFVQKRLALQYEGIHQEILTDRKWFCFVVEQLLSNAVKYTPSGTITIDISGDGRLRISDTGIGISPEDVPRVFEKGYTGYNGREQQKSTGIGLYLCKQVTEQLGHSLELSSKVAEGTTVTIGIKRRDFLVE